MTVQQSYFPADTEQPVLDLTVGDLLIQASTDSGDRAALVEVVADGMPSLTGADRTDRSWTYAELLQDARRCAGFLMERFRPGERVVVWAPNVPEWVILQYGAALSGLVLVTANPALRADELRYVLDQSEASALFYVDSFRGSDMAAIAATAVEASRARPDLVSMSDWGLRVGTWPDPAVLPGVAPMDPAQIQYTSGTTGSPKGALLHHRGLVTNALYIGVRGGLPRLARVASPMPLFHTAGCGMAILGTAHVRGTVYLLQMFDPALLLRTASTHRAQAIYGVPTMFVAMLGVPNFDSYDLGEASVGMSGGAAVPPELGRRIEQKFGLTLSTVYGQTELSPIVAQTGPRDSQENRLNTAGRPLWNVEVQILDPVTRTPVATGEPGEICARGYQTMLEYYDLPAATAETLDANGWLHTGDIGYLRGDGYLMVTGRLKDMIIRGGENIYPQELEDLLYAYPGIAEAAVVGVPDERWGEIVAAVLRPSAAANLNAADLTAYCREHLAPHKTPSRWFLTDEYPMTGSGKIQKFRITEAIVDGAYGELA